jgi:hypothetical protein
MNPDVSISLPDEATAERAADVLRGLYVHRASACSRSSAAGARSSSSCSCRGAAGRDAAADPHTRDAEFQAPFERHVHEHGTNDQSTAQHDEPGFLLAYSAGRTLELVRPNVRSPRSRRPSCRGSALRRSPG